MVPGPWNRIRMVLGVDFSSWLSGGPSGEGEPMNSELSIIKLLLVFCF